MSVYFCEYGSIKAIWVLFTVTEFWYWMAYSKRSIRVKAYILKIEANDLMREIPKM